MTKRDISQDITLGFILISDMIKNKRSCLDCGLCNKADDLVGCLFETSIWVDKMDVFGGSVYSHFLIPRGLTNDVIVLFVSKVVYEFGCVDCCLCLDGRFGFFESCVFESDEWNDISRKSVFRLHAHDKASCFSEWGLFSISRLKKDG